MKFSVVVVLGVVFAVGSFFCLVEAVGVTFFVVRLHRVCLFMCDICKGLYFYVYSITI